MADWMVRRAHYWVDWMVVSLVLEMVERSVVELADKKVAMMVD